MKYMGSKQSLLENGLGSLIVARSHDTQRIVDLFSGAGAVTWYAAESTSRSVLSVDLQHYSRVLAEAVLRRTRPSDPDMISDNWLRRAERRLRPAKLWRESQAIARSRLTAQSVKEARELCLSPSPIGPVWPADGGYYSSPAQAIAFDYLRDSVPDDPEIEPLCLAALVVAASRCAASPGHTAQPFRPTKTALKYINAAWKRDPFDVIRSVLPDLCRRYASVRGRAVVGDAVDVASSLTATDLAIVDPPYSSAQYSRFYHVLETIAKGECGPVDGAGRYPPITERPQSDFSKKSTAPTAVRQLLETLGSRGCGVIMTFPHHGASNGLEGEQIATMASEWFLVDVTLATSRFSTLGGNGTKRASRRRGFEMVLSLEPRG